MFGSGSGPGWSQVIGCAVSSSAADAGVASSPGSFVFMGVRWSRVVGFPVSSSAGDKASASGSTGFIGMGIADSVSGCR